MRSLVVIGDVVESRQIKGRAAFQKKLAALLAGISAGNAALASPYTLTLGDEFQAVYRGANGLFADLIRIRRGCMPAGVRFSLSAGRIATALNPRQAIGMDGPAFHRARERIEALKQSGATFSLAGDLPGDADSRDALLDLLSTWTDGWRANRWAILLGLMTGKAVTQLAEELRISEPAVYKNIRHGRLESWTILLKRQETLLDGVLRGNL